MFCSRNKLDLFFILLVITSIISKSTSNHYVNTTLNITSSDNNRLKIISFNVDQNAAVNVTYELMQSWDHILVKTIRIHNCFQNWILFSYFSAELFNVLQSFWQRQISKTLRNRQSRLLFKRWKCKLCQKLFHQESFPGFASSSTKFLEKMSLSGCHVNDKLSRTAEFSQQHHATWKICNKKQNVRSTVRNKATKTGHVGNIYIGGWLTYRYFKIWLSAN